MSITFCITLLSTVFMVCGTILLYQHLSFKNGKELRDLKEQYTEFREEAYAMRSVVDRLLNTLSECYIRATEEQMSELNELRKSMYE